MAQRADDDGSGATGAPTGDDRGDRHALVNRVVGAFLYSNLPIILILLAVLVGLAALLVTPREEDPQIVVPMADIHVRFPGHSAEQVEQLVATPLEKLLFQIDGVEYVYSMSMTGHAIITVRYYVGEDRERSLVKLFKRIDENIDLVPPGVTGWVVKPVEIDDVPIVTLTLTSATSDEYILRRVAEELVDRLAAVENLSRAYVIGGRPRVVYVRPDPERLHAHGLSMLEVRRAVEAANVTRTAGTFTRDDQVIEVEAGEAFRDARELAELVVGVFGDSPVFLRTVADIEDGPSEATAYVRHGWGPARGLEDEPRMPGAVIGGASNAGPEPGEYSGGTPVPPRPAVTIALAKKKGTNAVWVAREILAACESLKAEIVPDDIDVVITRNYGMTANDKVNELIEALTVAVAFVLVVLIVGLGWREALIVAVTIPVVFGLTLAVNLLTGFTINRVTLFALILSLGLLVDDPIVDVENITRHFGLRKRATRSIVVGAVAEIRPPLITATLAVIVSFLPMSFITGMMGPYMRPMALNVPVAMLVSMLVAFTITPWLAFQMLKRRYGRGSESDGAGAAGSRSRNNPEHGPAGSRSHKHSAAGSEEDEQEIAAVRASLLYRLFYPLMAPLLSSRKVAWSFMFVMAGLTVLAAGLAATRHVPLKMLPFDNKNEFLLVLDFDEHTTLERSDATVRALEDHLRRVPEVVDFTSYVGTASPMDFNGMVRHYYLREGGHVAEIRVNLIGKKWRTQQSHSIGLRLRDELTAIAARDGGRLKIVETPPGPPVIASVVAEVYGRPDHRYEDLMAAAQVVRARMEVEPFVVEVDDSIEADRRKLVFVTDKEKAALNGVSVHDVAETVRMSLDGGRVGTIRAEGERHPLHAEVRLPRSIRSSPADLARLEVKGHDGHLVPLAEIGRWKETRADRTIYHKNLERVVYVFAEMAGRPPAEAVVDVEADRRPAGSRSHNGAAAVALRGSAGSQTIANAPELLSVGNGWVADVEPRPLAGRTFLTNGSGVAWAVPEGIRVDFAGEGEWKITLDVFRDLGLAFGAALIGIYILLVGQTRSFIIPVVVMLAIPLTILGIMPGFWLLNVVAGGQVGIYSDPIFFTATGMIGMIALAGIVTRDSIILVDFIHLSLRRGRSLFDAIMESRVVRLRPILLTTATAMLAAVPITIDPIFSGLAWALIFGLLASTVFTLFVIPVAYWLIYANRPGHGLEPVRSET